MSVSFEQIQKDNRKRLDAQNAEYKPLEGIGCIGSRYPLYIEDFNIPTMQVNEHVWNNKLIHGIRKKGSIRSFIEETLQQEYTEDLHEEITKSILRVLCKYDFEFSCASIFWIQDKKTGAEMLFKLRLAQRKLLRTLIAMFWANVPIRVILLKARQWGGSTLIQVFIAWIQLFHKKRWNSNLVAHVKDTSYEIKGMYTYLLNKINESCPWILQEGEKAEFSPFERSTNIFVIPGRDCKIKLGSAEAPDSARGGNSAMVHCTEIGIWKKTQGKKPEDIIRSACSGVAMEPYTLIVYESTAKGTGNYFHKEWLRAKRGLSDKQPVFVAWFEIPELYSKDDINEREIYQSIWVSPQDDTQAEYEKFLFDKGATLQAIAWYREKLKEFNDHAEMMSEYPSTDEEAFQNSGTKVFKVAHVERLRKRCKRARVKGSLIADGIRYKPALTNIRFERDTERAKNKLQIWEYPREEKLNDQYVVVVDIGGRSDRSDPSNIVVFDRSDMQFGGLPEVVAEWHGHIDHDILVWEAARIAKYYNDALLVIESNTLESEKNDTDGDHTEFILDELKEYYPNLYCRTDPQKIIEGIPPKYGFNTNRSTKTMIIDNFIRVLRENGYIERSDDAVDEIMKYEKKENGSYGNPDGEGEHDDRVITRMIGMYICYELPIPKPASIAKMISRKIVNESTI